LTKTAFTATHETSQRRPRNRGDIIPESGGAIIPESGGGFVGISIQDAKTFCRAFFDWYNQHHRHLGIGLMTPD